MRDNSDRLSEILKITEEGDHFFCVVRLKQGEQIQDFKFGLSLSSRNALMKVLQTRPFDDMPGLKHRYYFIPGGAKIDDETARASFRIEAGHVGKNFDFILTKDLTANLIWFYELKDWNAAKYLMQSV